jgi:cytochrome b6
MATDVNDNSGTEGYLDKRFGLIASLKHEGEDIIPRHATLWPVYYMGGLSALTFLIQVATGILLMFYYKPSVEEAYNSVEFIMTEVEFGWFVRSVHHWCANLFVVLMILHMIRVVLVGGYKPPRELHWVTGVLLLLLGMMFGFTGYLLPWDQIAYWATTVGSEMTRSVPPPALGEFILNFLRGGENVSGDTLTRFFVMHVIILPVLTAVLIGVHLIMIRTTGISNPIDYKPGKEA